MTLKLTNLLGAAAVSVAALSMGALAASADTIKIGTVLSATGPASFLGDPEMKTLELYVKEINAAGGVDGNELELVAYDSGVDASKARTFATRLVEEDEVVAVVGGSTTGTTMAMIPVFEDAEIPFISLAGAVVIIDPVKKWVFKTPHTDRMACEKIFEDMQKRGISKVGMISGTGGFGKSMRDQCLDVAGNYDVEIIADETYGAKDSDMTPQLTNIKNTEGLEAVVNPGFGQGPAIVTRNYKQLGIDVPLYQSHGVASKSFIELAGDAAEGVRLPAAALLVADKLPDDDPQKSVVVGYKDKYEGATGEPVSTFGGHAYDGLMMLVEAIKRAGSADPAAIRDEIEKTSGFMGTAGVVNMSADDHLGLDLTAFRMLEVKNGDWTIAE
ncbi:branched-chain amino acid transport system substrate-binding protein [Rhodobium orientis]|uniref:ABC transporter substrate-binding protein n=2 Tax=Rhodobium orientis TaxID=34017 RepID=A0A327JRL7_9HYPH|nr:ABC transporter substrate-binding protein [Rhodobium orientis]MBB4302594.1 branched-chain amino acid transport system substrate-binding protein [Rhodobium orientis]MBK5951536.1 ABC transporter substrate-binding protein [Rhodobium orientis]RAI29129.1 ABC transporter substrate-binding protein [Rhodobium orientis]